jgi:hypothetical protein
LLFGGGADFFPQCQDSIQLVLTKSSGVQPLLSLEKLPPYMSNVVSKGVATDPKERPSLAEYRVAVTGPLASVGQNLSPKLAESSEVVDVTDQMAQHKFTVTVDELLSHTTLA